jgi:ABC-type Co2+ transport system permease subunit
VSALVIGCVSIALAVVVVIWLALRTRRLKRQRRMQRLAQPAMAGVAASALPLMMRASPIGTLLVVALAGYMLQRSTQRKR